MSATSTESLSAYMTFEHHSHGFRIINAPWRGQVFHELHDATWALGGTHALDEMQIIYLGRPNDVFRLQEKIFFGQAIGCSCCECVSPLTYLCRNYDSLVLMALTMRQGFAVGLTILQAFEQHVLGLQSWYRALPFRHLDLFFLSDR